MESCGSPYSCNTYNTNGKVVIDDIAWNGVSFLLLLSLLRLTELNLPPVHHYLRTL